MAVRPWSWNVTEGAFRFPWYYSKDRKNGVRRKVQCSTTIYTVQLSRHLKGKWFINSAMPRIKRQQVVVQKKLIWQYMSFSPNKIICRYLSSTVEDFVGEEKYQLELDSCRIGIISLSEWVQTWGWWYCVESALVAVLARLCKYVIG